jgi:hypothetical protein
MHARKEKYGYETGKISSREKGEPAVYGRAVGLLDVLSPDRKLCGRTPAIQKFYGFRDRHPSGNSVDRIDRSPAGYRRLRRKTRPDSAETNRRRPTCYSAAVFSFMYFIPHLFVPALLIFAIMGATTSSVPAFVNAIAMQLNTRHPGELRIARGMGSMSFAVVESFSEN